MSVPIQINLITTPLLGIFGLSADRLAGWQYL